MPTSPPQTDPSRREERLDEVLTAYLQAADAGRVVPSQALYNLYPDLADELRDFLADQQHVEVLAAPLRAIGASSSAANTHNDTPSPGPSAPTQVTAAAAARLADYELLEELGRGGMGVVFKARHVPLNRLVAVKTVL